ncbi:homing endonuclease HNH [Shewanella sp. phage 3/49]|uniref:HNH endonuclease n=1 Tax=Shewanella sp. phage 3/49 TaxID=1458863 RepID=UPI0004F92E38|nr:HNH endonuclease [Shewanella sp. phage 3/49]AHK11815.1 homing endonuclease HNH [Shewanella sp. phage 3/49]
MLTITSQWSVKRPSGNGVRIMCTAECSCGNVSEYMKENIKRGNTTKCKDCANKSRSEKNTKHGKSVDRRTGECSKVYYTWQAMKRRCLTDYDGRSAHYQSRGISICDEWANSFETFLADMGEPASKDLSIDRIDNNKGYYKENCRWATPTEQANNKTTNRKLTVNGTTKNLCQWSSITGIAAPTIRRRLGGGWSEHDAIMIDIGIKPKQ